MAVSQDIRINRGEGNDGIDSVIFGEIQLLLAEKRTSFSMLRTGIAVFALPLSVLSLLIATSRYYRIEHVLHFLIPLLILNGALVILAAYLVTQAIVRVRHYDNLIKELKRRHSAIAQFIS